MWRILTICFIVAVNAPAATDDKDSQLIEVTSLAPSLIVELRYATTNNFFLEKLYPTNLCLLRRPTATKLAAVQSELQKVGLGLKIFDAYRPLSVQRKMWSIRPDTRYVADPARGSRHNRGAAVDVTLVKVDGTELPMGTVFDDFSEMAHRDFIDLPPAILANRQRLAEVMLRHGFMPLRTEWWHFDDEEWGKYPLLNTPLSATTNDRRED